MAEESPKRLRWYFAGAIAGAAASVAMVAAALVFVYTTFASAEDVQRHQKQLESAEARLNKSEIHGATFDERFDQTDKRLSRIEGKLDLLLETMAVGRRR